MTDCGFTNGQLFTAQHEGLRLSAYPDVLGKLTIGRGRHEGVTIGMTCTLAQANLWFTDDYNSALHGAGSLYGNGWGDLPEARRAALTDMCFELGEGGLSEFHQMLASARAGDWNGAAINCLDSLYARQVPRRADEVAELLRTGVWNT